MDKTMTHEEIVRHTLKVEKTINEKKEITALKNNIRRAVEIIESRMAEYYVGGNAYAGRIVCRDLQVLHTHIPELFEEET